LPSIFDWRHDGSVNAAERFFAASHSRDVEAAASELAADVVMLNPATDDPVVGKDAVAAGLRAVEAACDQFRHTHLLVDASRAGQHLFGLGARMAGPSEDEPSAAGDEGGG
jgi:ketosteroid isomerase-like protein